MDVRLQTIAQNCLDGAYGNTMDFPDIVGTLMTAGFEGYTVDYRRGTSTYYLPDGDSVELANAETDGHVAAAFNQPAIADAIRTAQTKAAGYTYKGFCKTVKAAGCAGYLVSFSGRRVVYFGRTADVHVEHFPS
ncbi:DUF1398 family protein [Roseiarcaceae bacterium H3SJ34-1]|uniref:DUF1398 domain-containing protein n=1 Tax=Terripilifer ovatus TaxID=3032367 RepID=UPI003AB96B5F|nr:DUF1398 family protein [Roseiarcaceae bacterium H3SJ34-1]